MRLENWQIISLPFHHLIGDIYDDEKERFKDGDTIRTSPLRSIDFAEGTATTRNNTYRLGKPQIEGTRMYPKKEADETEKTKVIEERKWRAQDVGNAETTSGQ